MKLKEKKKPVMEEETEVLVRISGQDIKGGKHLYVGLTRIKGIKWVISNLICKKLGFDKKKKIGDLSKDEIAKIENFLKNFESADYLKNRRYDLESGESKHLFGVNLDMSREFDIKRLKKIKSYKGVRHSLKLPVRGQRTRSNFRKSGIAVGVKRSKLGKKS